MEELKEQIVQSLETTGILDKLRAQLRVTVFKVVQGDDKKPPKAIQETATPQGKLAVALFSEFLEFFGFNYTLSVFGPECHFSHSNLRQFISKELGLELVPNKPALYSLLAVAKSPSKLQIPERPRSLGPSPKQTSLWPIEKKADEEERQRLIDIDQRLQELQGSDRRFELSPGSSDYEDEDPCFVEHMLDEYDVVVEARAARN